MRERFQTLESINCDSRDCKYSTDTPTRGERSNCLGASDWNGTVELIVCVFAGLGVACSC